LDRMNQLSSALPGAQKRPLSFAGFLLETDGTLLRGKDQVHLPPKELAALRLLLAHAGQVVTPLQLRKALWGNTHVTANSIPKCLSSLRARLEPDKCIQTVYKRGYRFSAEVQLLGTEPTGKLPRLAILPFGGGYGVPQHLGAAIAEEAIARLSAARPSFVSLLAQDSSFTLARQGMTAQQIGEALAADLVLTGTLRTLPAHYRLRAEMIRVEDGTQLWVEDVLVERNRIAGLETELTRRVAIRLCAGVPTDRSLSVMWGTAAPCNASAPKGIQIPLSPLGWFSEVPANSASPTDWNNGALSIAASADSKRKEEDTAQHLEAYEIYQHAHYEWQTLQRHQMQDGLHHLLRATELNPSLIDARVDLVNLCVAQAFYGFMSPAVSAEIAQRTAESIPDFTNRAQAILPALGWISFHMDRNLSAALWAFSLAKNLPHAPWITRVYSMFALSRHRFSEAIDRLQTAIRLDPYSPWLHARLGWALHLSGRAEESIECIHHALTLFPEHEGVYFYGALILAYGGEASRAVELAQALTQHLPYFDPATPVLAYALAQAGRTDEARVILERLQWLSRERFVLKAFTPAVYVALGEPDAAIKELRASDKAHCPWFFQILSDPRLKPLHDRPEFAQMQAILPVMEAEAVRQAQ
jgi:DNA-binding winged helix-turn-helix (wHTH) protein/tetratricopeptide (TPR) repeat protein